MSEQKFTAGVILHKPQSDGSMKKAKFVISARPGIDWFSLGIALLIGVVFRYVHFNIPW